MEATTNWFLVIFKIRALNRTIVFGKKVSIRHDRGVRLPNWHTKFAITFHDCQLVLDRYKWC